MSKKMEVFTTSKLIRALERPGLFGVVANLGYEVFNDGFSFFSDPMRGLYSSLTVTLFNIQLAAYLGYTRIVLLGVDHYYNGEPTVTPGVPDETSVNHCSPEYRRAGRNVGVVRLTQM